MPLFGFASGEIAAAGSSGVPFLQLKRKIETESQPRLQCLRARFELRKRVQKLLKNSGLQMRRWMYR